MKTHNSCCQCVEWFMSISSSPEEISGGVFCTHGYRPVNLNTPYNTLKGNHAITHLPESVSEKYIDLLCKIEGWKVNQLKEVMCKEIASTPTKKEPADPKTEVPQKSC
ncbi:MAG: hypothetical protein VX777_07100 [Chlamydiota bacterium]|nr:hypothetical protein [Chlamydiota bacterium]